METKRLYCETIYTNEGMVLLTVFSVPRGELRSRIAGLVADSRLGGRATFKGLAPAGDDGTSDIIDVLNIASASMGLEASSLNSFLMVQAKMGTVLMEWEVDPGVASKILLVLV